MTCKQGSCPERKTFYLVENSHVLLAFDTWVRDVPGLLSSAVMSISVYVSFCQSVSVLSSFIRSVWIFCLSVCSLERRICRIHHAVGDVVFLRGDFNGFQALVCLHVYLLLHICCF